MTNRVPLIVNASSAQIQELPLTDVLSVAGNITAGNVTTAGLVSATGNVTGNYFVGNGSALTGIVSSSSATTYTATQTLNGSSSTVALKVTNIDESANLVASAPASTTNFYLNSGAVQYYTANANANFTLNFAFSSGTSLNTAMANNDTMSCTLLVTNGTSAYYPSAFQVDGSSSNVSVKWQGGTAPSSGDASAIDSYGFVIIKTASAAYTILASQTKFA
jgi:hypothetical protein